MPNFSSQFVGMHFGPRCRAYPATTRFHDSKVYDIFGRRARPNPAKFERAMPRGDLGFTYRVSHPASGGANLQALPLHPPRSHSRSHHHRHAAAATVHRCPPPRGGGRLSTRLHFSEILFEGHG